MLYDSGLSTTNLSSGFYFFSQVVQEFLWSVHANMLTSYLDVIFLQIMKCYGCEQLFF
jgi:hypothetical protein